ncbi:ribosomal protein S5 domain 2-like protein [Rickenella mellea]|uniref:Ribosomal protein S5 domain 2-like protein n=1 Tax=Rickenella mellea TaxID=50990 RepID=A0A4Y7QJN1_9AGAM|nr:ribosomal protein S5 domain 2-like protein [Rickenella mellea]
MSNLDNFLKVPKPLPKALATSQEIRDRGSIFVGAAYRASTPIEARNCIKHHDHVVHVSKRATHEIAAWRCMVLKHGKDGLGGPEDFELQVGCDDDGENWGGGKVLKTMQSEGVIDAVVIVSRWYGGTMLGPARFTHIETCAREACRTFKLVEDVEACVEELKEMDDTLTSLRGQLASLSEPSENTPSSTSKTHDYSSLLDPPDLAKAQRLVNARRNAIKSINALMLAKQKKPETEGSQI